MLAVAIHQVVAVVVDAVVEVAVDQGYLSTGEGDSASAYPDDGDSVYGNLLQVRWIEFLRSSISRCRSSSSCGIDYKFVASLCFAPPTLRVSGLQ